MAADATAAAPAAPIPAGLGAAAKFNPQLWKPDELRAIFVVRQGELAELVRRLEQAPAGTPPQHVLITGHRGMGKSTLLHRLALAVEDRPDLRGAWAPLLFREEQYTAVSLDKFWRNALDALSEALERRLHDNPALRADIQALDTINARLDAEPAAAVREQQALAALREWADRHGQRLLLLVDSTEQLFEALVSGKTSGDRPLWRLRECLSQDPRFLWVSCAYTMLEAHQGYDHPFHEFFAPLPLKPLLAADMRAAFLALAHTFGGGRGLPPGQTAAPLQQVLSDQPERLEALLRLAGGNPRTTVLLYQLLAAGGHDNVHTDLQRLLDDMSPLYKDRLEHQLAVQPRQLVATLMEHWAPMSAKALAQATALPVTQVNAQLSRLESSGWVDKVRLAGTRRHGYQVAERFFNVYYLMRLAPRRLRLRLTWLVEFMRIWFSEPDRRLLAAERRQQHSAGRWHDGRQAEFSRALALSLDDTTPERAQLELALYAQTVRGRIGDIVIFDTGAEDRPFASIDDYKARLAAVRAALDGPMPLVQATAAKRKAFTRDVMGSLSLSLDDKEQIGAVVPTFTQHQFDDLRKLVEDVRSTWTRLVGSDQPVHDLVRCTERGDFFPDAPDAALVLMQARAHFHDQPATHLLALHVAWSLRSTLGPELASQVVSLLASTTVGPVLLCSLAQQFVAIGQFGPAEKVLRQATLRAPSSVHPWSELGNLLQHHMRRFEEAEAAYRQAIANDPKLAVPWNNLGNLLQDHLQRYDEAEAAYRQAIAIDPKLAALWNNLGNLLQDHLQRYDEAEAAYRQAIAIDPKDAWPWNGLGCLLQYHLQRFDEAEAAFRQAITIDPKFAWPWSNLGILLQDQLQRFDEAEAAYRHAIAIDPAFAWPRANLARLYAAKGQRSEAANSYRQVIGLAEGVLTQDDIGNAVLTLQAHLYLGNHAAAAAALHTLSKRLEAQGTNSRALDLIREQAQIAHATGSDRAFADLLAADPMAGTLKPLELALRLLNQGETPLLDQPAELQALAREIAGQWPAAFARRTPAAG